MNKACSLNSIPLKGDWWHLKKVIIMPDSSELVVFQNGPEVVVVMDVKGEEHFAAVGYDRNWSPETLNSIMLKALVEWRGQEGEEIIYKHFEEGYDEPFDFRFSKVDL